MKRTRNLLGLTVAAIALAALTGCATGDAEPDAEIGTVEEDAPVEAPEESTADEGTDEGAAAPSFDGEGIAIGADVFEGIELEVICMGTGADLTLSGTGTDGEGNLHSVAYATGAFSYAVVSEDLTTSATSLTAGDEMPGTDVAVDGTDGTYTFTGTGEVASSDGSTGKQSFTANFTCDTTV